MNSPMPTQAMLVASEDSLAAADPSSKAEVAALKMAGSRVNRALDLLHKGVVGTLVVSTVYFSVEIVRATWHLQKTKVERQREVGLSPDLSSVSVLGFHDGC